jgi:hypothetical protein
MAGMAALLAHPTLLRITSSACFLFDKALFGIRRENHNSRTAQSTRPGLQRIPRKIRNVLPVACQEEKRGRTALNKPAVLFA